MKKMNLILLSLISILVLILASCIQSTSKNKVGFAIYAPPGACLINGQNLDFWNVIKVSAPNVSDKYAKFHVQGVNTIAGLKNSCTLIRYQNLAADYCAYGKNTNITYTYGTVTFKTDGTPSQGGGSAISDGNTPKKCPGYVAPPPKTTSTTTTQNATTTQPTCTAGTKCKDSSNIAYQSSNCTWGTSTFCQYGCLNGACKAAPSTTNTTTSQSPSASNNSTNSSSP